MINFLINIYLYYNYSNNVNRNGDITMFIHRSSEEIKDFIFHEIKIYDIKSKKLIGGIQFSVFQKIYNYNYHKNGNFMMYIMKDVKNGYLFPDIKDEFIDKIIYIDLVYIKSDFIKKGYTKTIYKIFNNIYLREFMDYKICRMFSCPIAHYVIKKMFLNSEIHPNLYDEKFIKYEFNCKKSKALHKVFMDRLNIAYGLKENSLITI
jgi:hypothetical protein